MTKTSVPVRKSKERKMMRSISSIFLILNSSESSTTRKRRLPIKRCHSSYPSMMERLRKKIPILLNIVYPRLRTSLMLKPSSNLSFSWGIVSSFTRPTELTMIVLKKEIQHIQLICNSGSPHTIFRNMTREARYLLFEKIMPGDAHEKEITVDDHSTFCKNLDVVKMSNAYLDMWSPDARRNSPDRKKQSDKMREFIYRNYFQEFWSSMHQEFLEPTGTVLSNWNWNIWNITSSNLMK